MTEHITHTASDIPETVATYLRLRGLKPSSKSWKRKRRIADDDDNAPFTPGRDPGSLGAVSCTVEELHEGGDHWVVVGRVVALHESTSAPAKQPLIFFRSRYAQLKRVEKPRHAPDEAWSNDAILIYHDEWTMGDDPPQEEHIRAHVWG